MKNQDKLGQEQVQKGVVVDEAELAEMLNKASGRQRVKTDLAEFEAAIRKMMELDISLPLVLTWLEKKGKITTLPALRRYVRKAFGEGFYENFASRNGWQKTKKGAKPLDENRGRRASDKQIVPGQENSIPPPPESKTAEQQEENIFNDVAKAMEESKNSGDQRRNS